MEHPPEVHEDSLLLSEDFTDEMMEMYSPTRQKPSSDSKPVASQASRSFPVKFLNIMDPLLPSNNLGRSVNKASFARIRKALAHGAQTLTSIVGKVCHNKLEIDDQHSPPATYALSILRIEQLPSMHLLCFVAISDAPLCVYQILQCIFLQDFLLVM